MLTSEQQKQIHAACERMLAASNLLQRGLDLRSARQALMLIGDEAITLGRAVEQVLRADLDSRT